MASTFWYYIYTDIHNACIYYIIYIYCLKKYCYVLSVFSHIVDDVGTCHLSLAVDYCPECNVEHSLVFGVFTTAGKGVVKGGPPNSCKTTNKIRRGDTIIIFWSCHPTNENRWKHIRYFFQDTWQTSPQTNCSFLGLELNSHILVPNADLQFRMA